MSDTPRTDKALFRVAKEFGDLSRVPLSEPVVTADFARQLERDNAQLREALNKVLADARIQSDFAYLDNGIGTATALGKTLLEARALLAELEAKP